MIFWSLLFMHFLLSFVLCNVKEKAVLEIVMHKITKNGEYKVEKEKIVGHFSAAGSTVSAEGDILQIHPMSICSQDVAEQLVYGWVGVMRLEQIQAHCMSLYEQAKVAIRRGATAVVFDVTDVPQAARLLQRYASMQLDRPVIIISGRDAARLVTIIQTQEDAWARIRKFNALNLSPNDNNTEFLEVGIFVAVFVIVCVLGIVTVIFKCRRREQQLSMSELAKQAIAKLETRKYQFTKEKSVTRVTTPTSDVYSQTSSLECCAICLEEYREGQVLRVLPCSHEFHRGCVDPWLVDKRTCPFCMYNIIESHNNTQQSSQVNSYTEHRTPDQRQFYQLPPNDNLYPQIQHSNYLHYLNYHTQLHNACTSCEGTMGSSDSSCNSHYRQFHQNNHHHCTHEPVHQSYYHALPSCCAKNKTTEIGRVYPCTSFISSGITYSHHVTASSFHHHVNYCQTHRQISNSTHHYYFGNSTRLFQYRAKKVPTQACDSDPEYTSGKDISIKAQYGSCSSDSCSDHVPSNGSLNCPECVRQCDNVADSNLSTCGSCENQDCSDNSSYDSNVFWGGAPDQMCTDVSSEKTSISGISYMESVTQFSDCQNKLVDGHNCRKMITKDGSLSTLNLSDISGCGLSVKTCESCSNFSFQYKGNSSDQSLNLSEISGLTDACSVSSSTSQITNECFQCCHSNSEHVTSSECNTVPGEKYKYSGTICNSANTLPKDVNLDMCKNCVLQTESSKLDNFEVNCVQTICKCSKQMQWNIEGFRRTNHDWSSKCLNHNHKNTQGHTGIDTGKLHTSPKTVVREKNRNLLQSFRLSRSCDILPSIRGVPDQQGDHIISRQPKLIAKDSVVTATSQGSSVTVYLKDHMQNGHGNAV